jgi:hypothetical protein
MHACMHVASVERGSPPTTPLPHREVKSTPIDNSEYGSSPSFTFIEMHSADGGEHECSAEKANQQ